MNSPYKYQLDDMIDQDVTIDRDGAPPVKGRVSEVEEGGCTIAVDTKDYETSNFVFIAFEHIRGIGHEGADAHKIGK
jgi:hypothetical protein